MNISNKVLAWITSIIVLAVVITVFVTVGSPSKQRALRFDEVRQNHLQSIQTSIINYWQQKSKLPATLSDLNDSISGFSVPVDPETQASYEYTVKSGLSFELCANFGLPSNANTDRVMPMMYPGIENWSHPSGHYCFSRTIDPQLYKPVPPLPVK